MHRAGPVVWGLVFGLVLVLGLFQGQAPAAESLLPNLVADPPDGSSLATDSSSGTARLLLRFSGYVHNLGPGAVDFRGAREAPKVSKQVEEEVKLAKEHQSSLPQKVEEELASPPMKVFQRLFTTNAGSPAESEKYLERPHADEPSGGEMIYVSADGHHHWHLQKVAKYSLWNASKTAEMAPAQKVGFCLEDSQHVEAAVGPATPVYSDKVPPYRQFCQEYSPNATSLYEGISPGWRDVYGSELAFQWVDVSNVLPGEYWLREDVNPLAVIRETGGENKPAYAAVPTIIPGFDALPQAITTQAGEPRTVTLTAKVWSDTTTPVYKIVSSPQHGTLGAIVKNQVTYTPNSGYTGLDSFTFSAADPTSSFPTNPAVATATIQTTASTGKVLLAGDATASYPVADQTTAGREEAFQFTAKSSGTVEELQFRTNATANTGITGLVMGILADNAGKPGEVLGSGKVTGEPATNSWIKATGLSTPIVNATKYWLVVLPLGENTKKLHFNAAALSNGTGNVESITGGLTTLTAQSNWETYNQGPTGFQALGSSKLQPTVTIEGAPSSMTAGTSVQLSAHVTNDSPNVTWKASAGSITTGGLYTAPSEPPAGGTALITATSTLGAKDQRVIEIKPLSTGKVLLAGDATASYPVADQTTAGREEAFQFTAKSSGTVEELQFRTNATANTGVTGLVMGILADNAGKPGEVLGSGKVTGEPATNSWIKATGLSTPIVNAAKYWLVVLPLGENTKKLHFNAAALSNGTGNVESITGGLTTLTAQSNWETYNQGPTGFQALGSASATGTAATLKAPSLSAASTVAVRTALDTTNPGGGGGTGVAIAGAPTSMIAGTSVQLSATATGGLPVGTWSASAGAITADGIYSAPSVPPSSGAVSILARDAAGAYDRRTVEILPVPPATPAPLPPLLEATSTANGGGFSIRGSSRLAVPTAILVGRTLAVTTSTGIGGRVSLSAYLGKHRIGHCTTATPAGRSFTCRLRLRALFSPRASIRLVASLRVKGHTLRSSRPAAPIPEMTMGSSNSASGLLFGHRLASWPFICGASVTRLVSQHF